MVKVHADYKLVEVDGKTYLLPIGVWNDDFVSYIINNPDSAAGLLYGSATIVIDHSTKSVTKARYF